MSCEQHLRSENRGLRLDTDLSGHNQFCDPEIGNQDVFLAFHVQRAVAGMSLVPYLQARFYSVDIEFANSVANRQTRLQISGSTEEFEDTFKSRPTYYRPRPKEVVTEHHNTVEVKSPAQEPSATHWGPLK